MGEEGERKEAKSEGQGHHLTVVERGGEREGGRGREEVKEWGGSAYRCLMPTRGRDPSMGTGTQRKDREVEEDGGREGERNRGREREEGEE